MTHEQRIDQRYNRAKALSPILRLTGFRFSKDYRWGVSSFHRFVYKHVSTVTANLLADDCLSHEDFNNIDGNEKEWLGLC